jgi:hypothetical protein
MQGFAKPGQSGLLIGCRSLSLRGFPIINTQTQLGLKNDSNGLHEIREAAFIIFIKRQAVFPV